jgi:hypothetical protein
LACGWAGALGDEMGAIFKVPGAIIYAVGGLWGLIVCLGIISDKFGTIGGIIAFFLFPFALYLAPWYAAFANGNWFPVLLVYGTSIVAAILFSIGSAIDRN